MAQNEYKRADDEPDMVNVVGVRFRRAGKIYYFDPGDHVCQPGDRVVVETEGGKEVGEVAIRAKLVPAHTVVMPLRSVVRPLTEQDTGVLVRHRQGERSALDVAFERAEAHGLDMKFVSAETAFDGNRVRLFFVSEERVDFRQLVRDLAGRLRARIELRQIGVRDQAKMVGGIGDCGRELCCTTWMGDFEPVSIRMAKTQSLSLNPSRLSGQCGRLKCCLKFEHDMYRDLLKELPKIGTNVITPKGRGRVIELLAIKESVLVDLGDGRRVVVKASELRREGDPAPAKAEADAAPEEGDGAYTFVAATAAAEGGEGAPAPRGAAKRSGGPREASGEKRAEGRGSGRRRRRRRRRGPKKDGGQG